MRTKIIMSFQSFVDAMTMTTTLASSAGQHTTHKTTTTKGVSSSSNLGRTTFDDASKEGDPDETSASSSSGGKKRKLLKTTAIVCGWFASTVLLISFNKILMRDGSKFRLPIFLTFMHMCVAYACCEVVLSFKERSAVAAFRSHSSSTSNNSKVGWVSARQQLQSNRQFWKIFALSQTFAVSIVAAVASLEYLEVSFEQAIAACTPAVTAFMGMVILRKKEHWRVWASLTPVILGGMVTAGEPISRERVGASFGEHGRQSNEELFTRVAVEQRRSCRPRRRKRWIRPIRKVRLVKLFEMDEFNVCVHGSASVEFEGVCAIKAALRSAYEENDLAGSVANCAGALVNISQF